MFVRHVVEVPGAIPVQVFDYSFVTGSQQSRTTHRRKLALATLPARLPEVRIRTGEALGWSAGTRYQQVGSADFDARFLVDGAARAVHDLLHPSAVEWLLAQAVDHFELDGDIVLVDFGSGTWDPPKEHGLAASHLLGFVALVPDYVWRTAGVEPPPIP